MDKTLKDTAILFFTTAIEHTTFRKTAKMLHVEGANIHIIGFTRNNFPENQMDGLSIECLGTLSHGNYFSRMIKLFKFLFLLRKRAHRYDVIYNFTLDTLIISKLALLFKRKKWIYQVQDIRTIYFENSIKSKFTRFLESVFIKRINLLVLSSEDYYTGYYKINYDISKDKVQVIENKLVRESVLPTPILRTDNKLIRIGYFGVMRCRRSWEILKSFTEKNTDKFALLLRGKPVVIPNIEEEISGSNNIVFEGLYRSPDDLNELYNRVDIVWACYPYSENRSCGNWKLARTIRFYEACAFGRPVIVQKGTPQAKDVVKYNIGLVVDMEDVDQCYSALAAITRQQLSLWEENIIKLPSSFYYHDQEYRELLNRIESF